MAARRPDRAHGLFVDRILKGTNPPADWEDRPRGCATSTSTIRWSRVAGNRPIVLMGGNAGVSSIAPRRQPALKEAAQFQSGQDWMRGPPLLQCESTPQ